MDRKVLLKNISLVLIEKIMNVNRIIPDPWPDDFEPGPDDEEFEDCASPRRLAIAP